MDEMQQLIVALVQAAMQGDQQATQQIEQIKQAAQQGDQQAAQMMLMIDVISKQLATSAKNGAKLQYIQRLRNKCPEGYELEYFKAGGKVCSKCAKKAAKAKMEKGGSTDPDYIQAFKAKCGGKVKKHEDGEQISKDKMYKKVNENLPNGNRRVHIVGQNDDPKDVHTAEITAKGDTTKTSPKFRQLDNKYFSKKK